MNLTDTLRKAVADAPSRYQIHKATGIAQSTLSRFVNGGDDLRLRHVEKLLTYLGFTLSKKKGGAK